MAMNFVLIFYAQIILLLLETTSSQYEYQSVQNAFYQNPYQNMYQNSYPIEGFETQDDYEEPQNYRRSRKHKRKHGSSGGTLPLVEDSNEESEECKCSCNSCADVEPCCKDACNCNTQNQPNVVIMPYLYPLVVTQNVVTDTTTTTTSTTTTSTTTTTTTPKPIRVQETNINFDIKPISRRRTKPVWLPKYGIVPLPDHLAQRLMSKLRDVKGLKAERRKR